MQIEHISYKHGMINKPSHRKKLHAKYLRKGNIPDEIAALIEKNGVMSIKGTLGEKEGGHPIEYEEVKIKAEGHETSFEVYNQFRQTLHAAHFFQESLSCLQSIALHMAFRITFCKRTYL